MIRKTPLHLVAPPASGSASWLDGVAARFDEPAAALLRRVYAHVAAPLKQISLHAGETALDHACAMTDVLLALDLDHESAAAALLVPLLRAKPEVAREIRETFGATIAELAEGVVRMGEIGALSNRAVAPGRA
jgi:(p)ppGpp synthase/HD superfamily hydrolase